MKEITAPDGTILLYKLMDRIFQHELILMTEIVTNPSYKLLYTESNTIGNGRELALFSIMTTDGRVKLSWVLDLGGFPTEAFTYVDEQFRVHNIHSGRIQDILDNPNHELHKILSNLLIEINNHINSGLKKLTDAMAPRLEMEPSKDVKDFVSDLIGKLKK